MEVFVGFEHNHGIVSKLIQWFRRSKWNHCFMAYRIFPHAPLIVVEANAGGVQRSPISDKDSRNYDLISVPLENPNDAYLVFDAMTQYIGKPYGYLQLFGMILPSLFERIGLRIGNWFGSGIICSELCYLILKRIIVRNSTQYTVICKLSRNSCAPDDIYDAMR